MPVLKHQEALSAIKEAIVLDMGDLQREAARIMADAKAHARQIVAEAQQRKEAIASEAHDEAYRRGEAAGLKDGREEGRQEGKQEALQQAKQKFQQVQDVWIKAIDVCETTQRDIDREARQAVLDFALLLTHKLIHRVIKVDDSVIVDQVSAALSHVLRPIGVAVRIHPDDRPTLEQAMPQLMAKLPGCEHVRLVDDPSVGAGGCVVSSGSGQIDATLQTQMDRIVQLLLPEGAAGDHISEGSEPS